MPRFITRIELHFATDADYKKLHGEMEKLGFARTIKGSDGALYKLPEAEYYLANDGALLADVLGWAKKAANATSRSFAAIVSEALMSTWFGLNTIQQQASPISR